MEEQNRTAIIYEAQRKMLAADYEMAEIRGLLNELMALEELDEVITRANSFIAEAELRISRKDLPAYDSEVKSSVHQSANEHSVANQFAANRQSAGNQSADEQSVANQFAANQSDEKLDMEQAVIDTEAAAEIVLNEQKRIIEKLLSHGIVPAQIHQWLDFPMEMIIETYKNMKSVE